MRCKMRWQRRDMKKTPPLQQHKDNSLAVPLNQAPNQ